MEIYFLCFIFRKPLDGKRKYEEVFLVHIHFSEISSEANIWLLNSVCVCFSPPHCFDTGIGFEWQFDLFQQWVKVAWKYNS